MHACVCVCLGTVCVRMHAFVSAWEPHEKLRCDSPGTIHLFKKFFSFYCSFWTEALIGLERLLALGLQACVIHPGFFCFVNMVWGVKFKFLQIKHSTDCFSPRCLL